MANRTSFSSREEWLRYQREYREKNRSKIKEINKKWRIKRGYDWNKSHPVEAAAHQIVKIAVRSGTLKVGACKICHTKEQMRAHHKDYSKPLDVIWLCEKHHREVHNSTGQG